MTIEKVKGFRDIFAPESLKKEKIIGILQEKAKLFGFMPAETPTIEYDELLKGDNGNDEAVSDRFRLKDKGNRDLGLRFEFTVQLPRILKEFPNVKLPWRRYQVGNIFRDEPLRAERYREFSQFDADIIGDESINADAECLAFADSVLKELGIKAEIKINNRKLLNSILQKSNITKNQQQILREIDKMDKLSQQEIKKNLNKFLSEKQIKDLFNLFSKNLDYFTKNNFSGSEEIKELENLGKIYGFKIKFTPILMRGFSYYTGNVWEIWSNEKKAALAGGGRYDDKVGKYVNRKISAVGISFGTLLDYDKIDILDSVMKYLIISLNQDKEAINLAQQIRSKGKSAMIYYGKPSKALEYANSNLIQNAVFVGEKEIKSGKFKVKNLKTGKESLLRII
ncbi:histidine--tRNA ligase family protein [Candidatus Pacearchaeota archaeon]|nr:histidine--tRNA ligase family protein [Candidatus Pacearchaeota archaeon]